MKGVFNRFWPMLIIGALWVAFSTPYFFRGLVPFPSTYLVTFFPPWNAYYGMPVKNNAMPDVISQIYPWKKLTIDTWKSGSVPLWNPYSFSGTPHAANYQTAVFSPVNLLFFILPFLDAWSIAVLLQPIVAGVGMYVLLRRFFRSKTGATIGAIAFMFSGFMTTWMAYGTLGYAIAFLPWALWGVTTDFLKPSAFSRVVLTASVAFSFLSGHFQISVYLLATIFAYIIYMSLVSRHFVQGAILIAYVLAGLMFAAPQLFLTIDAYRTSTRGTSFEKIEVIPWKYLITLFSPDFYGNPVTRNDWFGHYAEWASYIGTVPLMFAILAFRRTLADRRLFFTLLAVGALLFAYPTPMSDILFRLKLPAISTSAASRIIVLLSFSLAVLSSYGFDDCRKMWKTGAWKTVALYACLGVVVLACAWVYFLVATPLPPDKFAIAKRNSLLPTAFFLSSFLFLALGALKIRFVRRVALLGICAVALFDSYRFASKWMPFDSREYVYPDVPSLTFMQSKKTTDRMFGNIGNEVGNLYHLPLVEGYDALYQGRYAQFINSISNGTISPGTRSVVQFDKRGKYKTVALQLLGIRYIYQRWSDGRNSWAFPYWEYTEKQSMRPVYNDEIYQVYEYADAFPRAFLASSYMVTADDWRIMQTLLADDFDRRETVILEKEPILKPAKGEGKAEIASYTPNSVTIKTSSSVPKLLFLSDVFDPGWSVTIDGKNSNVYRANYDFRAVAVDAGNHTIQFTYFPQSFRYGLFLCALAFMLLIAGIHKTNHAHWHL